MIRRWSRRVVLVVSDRRPARWLRCSPHLLRSYRPSKPRETSAERTARKAERKSQKAADAALLLPQDARQAAAEVSFYSSNDNPFHDANLGDKFVWGKKREKERKSGMTQEEAALKDRNRAMESVVSPGTGDYGAASVC